MTTQETRQRRARQVRRPQPDIVVTDGQPLATVTIYKQTTLLTRRIGVGWTCYPISEAGLASVLGKLPTSSGLLPQNTLAYGRHDGVAFYAVYVPARRATLRMASAEYDIPIPPLVWGGRGDDFRIFALGTADYPKRADVPLMSPPFPNSYPDGRICWGSSDPRPSAAPDTLLSVLNLFLEGSYFNLHVANNKSRQFSQSVVALWEQLRDKQARKYPLGDLVPVGLTLDHVLSGAAWGARPGQADEALQPDVDEDDDYDYEDERGFVWRA